MNWLFVGLAFFIGGTLGVVAGALAAAAHKADEFWTAYQRGYADGVRSEQAVIDLPVNPN